MIAVWFSKKPRLYLDLHICKNVTNLLILCFDFFLTAVSSMSIHDFGPGMVLYNVHNRGDNTMDTYASSDIVLHIRYHGSTNVCN